MRILIDECLPARLKNSFVQSGHDCRTVQDVGIANKKNGDLLSIADGDWDVLLTNDKNIKFQQNMTGRQISVLVLRANSNRLSDLLPLVPACNLALASIRGGQVIEIGPIRGSAT
jgi:predicted nuclease of predicted toxin-antitoxin system